VRDLESGALGRFSRMKWGAATPGPADHVRAGRLTDDATGQRWKGRMPV